MADGIPCAVCGWTQTAHDMAAAYFEEGYYEQCRHKYVPERHLRLVCEVPGSAGVAR